MNAGLVNPFVNALAIDPSRSTRIYAGTDGGVFDFEERKPRQVTPRR
jgi:hypothetical protein